MSERYVMQATRDEKGVLTFHLIPPLTAWTPDKYVEMIADLTGHIADYLSVQHEDIARLVHEEIARRSVVMAMSDPLMKGDANGDERRSA